MSAEFKNNISRIKQAIESDQLVVFAGAGISKDSGIPLWSELIKLIKGQLNEEIQDKNPIKIDQILYNEKGEKEYNDIVEDLIFKNAGKYNPIHEAIFDLNPQHIITTNYDYYFEDIIKDKGLPFSSVSKDIDLPYAKHKSLLIKYHGDFKNKNIVFKENDYLEFSKDNTLKETFVKSLFSNKVILFLGYRVGDQNLKYLIREIQYILKKHHQRSFLLSHKSFNESEKQYFNDLGINILQFPNKDQGFEKEFVKKKEELSSVGNKVYKTLKYISEFDLFKYERERQRQGSDLELIDDLYSSIKRFHYFRVLPKSILRNLYPFNKSVNNSHNIEATTLIDYNGELHPLLENYVGEKDDKYGEEEKRKLNYILGRLIYSNIYYVGIKVGKPDSLGNKRTGKEIKLYDKYFTKNKTCDCLACSFGSYHYSKTIQKIEKQQVTHSTDLENDLLLAYSLYQMGEYYKSFQTYKELKIKANRLKCMDVSFICAYNMQRIGLHIQGYNISDQRYSFSDLDLIRKESENIDLNKELLRIRGFLDKEVYNFLLEIRDGWYIQRLCNEIDNLFVSIQNDVKIIEKGGASRHPYYYNLYNAVAQLDGFLNGSYVIGNGFSMIEDAFRKSIKTFILGFYIGTIKLDSYQKNFDVTKFEAFNKYLFKVIVDYEKPKDLLIFLKEHQIENLKFDEGSQQEVVSLISNFFKSAVKENNFFNSRDRNEVFINYINYNENFKNKILRQFNNICIVLSYFEFSKEQIETLYPDFNLFLKYTNFIPHKISRYFHSFIENKREIIRVESLKETLEILNNKNLQYEGIYIEVLRGIQALEPEFINKKFLIKSIKAVEYGNIRHDSHIIYKSLPEDKKEVFVDEVETKIAKHFDLWDVYILLINHVPLKEKTIKLYQEKIHEIIADLKAKDIQNRRLINYVIRYFELLNLNLIDDKEINQLQINCEFLKFLINPKGYNFSKIDVHWFKLINSCSLIDNFIGNEEILELLKKNLIGDFDKEFSKIYFKLQIKNKY